jgi:hypothetical protein
MKALDKLIEKIKATPEVVVFIYEPFTQNNVPEDSLLFKFHFKHQTTNEERSVNIVVPPVIYNDESQHKLPLEEFVFCQHGDCENRFDYSNGIPTYYLDPETYNLKVIIN